MSAQIVPLAITMMAGPQIMSAIIFVTAEKPIPPSVAFVLAVALGCTLGVIVTRALAGVIGFDEQDSSSSGDTAQYVLVALLLVGILRQYRNRATIEPPKLLGKLQTAGPGLAFKTGITLIMFFPSDVLVLLTVGVNLEQHEQSVADALPFIGMTTLIAALPLLAYLLFRRRAVTAMPKVRAWMTNNAWLVNVIVLAIFIVLITA